MCGIAGIFRFDGQNVELELLKAMTDRITHRGPDAEGFWLDGSIGFGHRRLAIIDVEASSQPMTSADSTHHITFNGEILNYRALRDAQYAYKTQGDTEVILSMHQKYGVDAPVHFVGQFAYGLFDRRNRKLQLVRDRLGILPLFYYRDDTMIAFASEIKALFPALPRTPAVDPASLDAYLAQRAVPSPNTMLVGIKKLQPGQVLEVSQEGIARTTTYWTAAVPVAVDRSHDMHNPQQAIQRVRAALEQSVADNLVADVPVGSMLSGGVDSSLIVALAAASSHGTPIETFSAGFAEPEYDERPFANMVANYLKTNHHEVVVKPTDLLDLWHDLSWHRDAPLSEPADVAVHLLAKLAREHVKVVLSGEGSDELFGGYPKHLYASLTEHVGMIPRSVRRVVFHGIDLLPAGGGRRGRIAMSALAEPRLDERFRAWFSPFLADERRRLVGFAGRRWQPDVLARATGTPLQNMLFVDMHSWLSDNLLERGDRMTMASSIELRPPFLHPAVVDLALSLPPGLKIRRGETKWIIKEVAAQFLPAEIVRRKKVGFRLPLSLWFRGELRDYAHDRLLNPASFVANNMDLDSVRSILSSHSTGIRDEDIRIWTLLSLEVWHESMTAHTPDVGSRAALPKLGVP